MTNDPSKRGPVDRSRINLDQDWEVRYWASKFGVTEDELRDAVKIVGSSAVLVEQTLSSRSRQARPPSL